MADSGAGTGNIHDDSGASDHDRKEGSTQKPLHMREVSERTQKLTK